jgi:hypothetical protein
MVLARLVLVLVLPPGRLWRCTFKRVGGSSAVRRVWGLVVLDIDARGRGIMATPRSRLVCYPYAFDS